MSEDLRPWLAEIGLEQYAEIFVANDIDLDVLPDLSDDDLKELGLSLGHRRSCCARFPGACASDRSRPSKLNPLGAPWRAMVRFARQSGPN